MKKKSLITMGFIIKICEQSAIRIADKKSCYYFDKRTANLLVFIYCRIYLEKRKCICIIVAL